MNVRAEPGLERVDPDPLAAPPMQGRRWSDGRRTVKADPNAPWSMAQHWPELVAALSEQAVDSSNLLLRALDFLVGAGRLRNNEAKALSDTMYELRETSLRAQQITRLAGGRIRQAKEHVDLMDLVGKVIEERKPGFAALGARVSANLGPADVLLDPPVAVTLLNTVFDWAQSFSREIVVSLQEPEWPTPARLQVRVTLPRRGAQGDEAAGVRGSRPSGRRLNDGLYWMLLRQLAASAGLHVVRKNADGADLLTIEFPKTFLSSDGIACMELRQAPLKAAGARESWVLIVTADTQVQRIAIDSLRRTGIEAIAANDIDEARKRIEKHKPSLLVVGFDVREPDFGAFRTGLLGEGRCPVVEITRDTPTFRIGEFDGDETAKVGRDQLEQELPATVLFELVKLA